MTRGRMRKTGTLASAGVLVSAGLFGAYVGNPRLQRAYATAPCSIATNDTTLRAALDDSTVTCIEISGGIEVLGSDLPIVTDDSWVSGPRESSGLTIYGDPSDGIDDSIYTLGVGIAGIAINLARNLSPVDLAISDLTIAGFHRSSTGAMTFPSGGAVYLNDASYSPQDVTLRLSHTSFAGNAADQEGGAVFVSGLATRSVTIESSHFSDNQSANSGGALRVGSSLTASVDVATAVTVSDSTFTDNASQFGVGGAVAVYSYTSAASIIIDDTSVFERNAARYGGGAVSVNSYYGNASATVVQSSFVDDSTTGYPGHGGALYVGSSYGSARLSTEASLFLGNEAVYGDGGAVAVRSTDYSSAGDVRLDDTGSVFSGNRSSGSGGAIDLANNAPYPFSVDGFLTGSTLTANTSASQGGAIHARTFSLDAYLAFTGSTVSYNNADDSGGAVSSIGKVNLYESSVVGNTSSNGSGGGVYATYNVRLVNSYVGGNEAYDAGGAYARGALISYFSTIYDNAFSGISAVASALKSPGAIVAIGSAVGTSAAAGPLLYGGPSGVPGFYSVSTYPNSFSDPTTRNLNPGELHLRPIDDTTTPGHGGRTPFPNSPLIPGAPNDFAKNVKYDQLGVPRLPGSYTIGARQYVPLCSATDDTVVVTGPTDDTLAAALRNPDCSKIYIDGQIGLTADLPVITYDSWVGGPRDSQGLTIQGWNGLGDDTIDGGGQFRGLKIDLTDPFNQPSSYPIIDVRDLSLSRLYTSGSGGALNVTSLSSPTVNLTDMQAGDDTALLDGGAIFLQVPQEATLNITDSTLTGNTSLGGRGGAVHVEATDPDPTLRRTRVNIYGSSFTFNSADDSGGAIYANNVNTYGLPLSPTTFADNQSLNGEGGAIAATYTVAAYDAVAFEWNSASGGDGGAIHADRVLSGRSYTDQGPVFDRNAASGRGGAIYVGIASANSLIRHSLVTRNLADLAGGGIANAGSLHVENSTISANSTEDFGGGISSSGDLEITASSMTLNDTFDNGPNQRGGAIYMDSSGPDLVVTNSFIGRNRSFHHGGISSTQGEVRLYFSTLYDNYNGNSAGASEVAAQQLVAVGSAVGNGASSYVLSSALPVDDTFSVATTLGSSGTLDDTQLHGLGSHNVAPNTLALGPLVDDDTPGWGSLIPDDTSVLAVLPPGGYAPTYGLGTSITADQVGTPRPAVGEAWTIGSRQVAGAPASTYAVTFHSNFGADDTTIQFEVAPGLYPLNPNPFSRPGYTFLGWATSPTGPVAYLDQAQYNFSGTSDLFAQWRSSSPAPGPGPEPTPTPTPTPSPTPVPPVPAGGSSLTVNGVSTPVQVDPNSRDNGLDVTGPGFTMTLDGLGPDGKPLNLGPDNALVLDAERDVRTTGTGFAPGTQVGLYIDPPATVRSSWLANAVARAVVGTITLGTLTVNPDGTFAGTKTLPESLEPGDHVLQAVGYGPGGVQRVLNLGIIVRPWIELDKGTRKADGRHDRIRATGDTGGIDAGTKLTPYIRYRGQTQFAKGKATVTVQSDGTFTWTRQIKKSKGLAAYVAHADTKSNTVYWKRLR